MFVHIMVLFIYCQLNLPNPEYITPSSSTGNKLNKGSLNGIFILQISDNFST